MRYRKLIFAMAVCTIADALPYARPGAQWAVRGNTYADIEWLDKNQTKPTQKEIDQAVSDCLAAQTTKETQKQQAITDAKDTAKDAQTRINALINAIDLK